MIPILYETNETAFVSNGIGRLRDCISCIVTEERNGIYECDFEYPVTGANYELIEIGRIIGVRHDESNDIQPFDIVSFSKPIDGIVTFHCTHISYRQNYISVTTGTTINTLSGAFSLLATGQPSNPFTYQTDKSGSGFLACADGTPRTVRQVLGGIEGSILDTWGGEYEWNKWNVYLHSARGVNRPFTIRYGVNMLEYNDDTDNTETYDSCIPYWTGNDLIKVASRISASGKVIGPVSKCVPLDLTEKFETEPTTTQLRNTAKLYMNSNKTYLSTQSISIKFARLQDLDGANGLDNLYKCNLCDTINVIFPDYKTEGQFKIVKTVWNVLTNKYDEMELGTLATTLSDALGITNGLDKIGTIPTPSEMGINDYITEKGKKTTSGTWYYEKWNSGKIEAWGENSTGTLTMAASGSMYRATNVSVAMASGIFSSTPTYVEAFASYTSAVFVNATATATSTTNLSCLIWKATNATASVDLKFHVVYYPSNYS